MTVWTGMSAGARTAVVVGGAAVLAILGYFGFMRTPEPAPPPPAEVAALPATEAAAPAASEPAPSDPAPAPAPQTDPAPVEAIAPALDVVRVAPDGSATVAGKAEPGATVSLRVDGAEVVTVTADAAGNFVALFDLVASELPRLLTVVAIGADGREVAGADSVALAPILPQVADAAGAPAVLPAPAAILVSPEGVKVLQPAIAVPSEVAANVFVDTIAYTADGAVQLGGHGQAGGALRVYLDSAAVAETSVGADGTWSLVLGDVAPGIYTLRVDQLAADGSVTSRFETPFKRETLQALAEASAAAAPATAPETAAPETAAAEVAPQDTTAPDTALAEPVSVADAATPQADAGQAEVSQKPADGQAPATEPVAEVSPPAAAAEAPADSPSPQVATDAPTAAAPATAAADAPQVATIDPAPAAPAVEPAPTAPAQPAPPSPAGLVSVTVQPGYTLWGIAKEQFGSGVLYVQVFDANREKIKNPDLIYPGQIFLIPGKN